LLLGGFWPAGTKGVLSRDDERVEFCVVVVWMEPKPAPWLAWW
jgi:hypothetical protein